MGFFIKNDRSGALLEALPEIEEAALEAVGLEASGDMRLEVTVDTGYLKNSITYALGGGAAAVQAYQADRPDESGEIRQGSYSGTAEKRAVPTVYVGTNCEYGPYVEDGTSLTPGKPYIKPTIMREQEKYKKIYASLFQKGVSDTLT